MIAVSSLQCRKGLVAAPVGGATRSFSRLMANTTNAVRRGTPPTGLSAAAKFDLQADARSDVAPSGGQSASPLSCGLRGLTGARDEFILAALVQNLKTLHRSIAQTRECPLVSGHSRVDPSWQNSAHKIFRGRNHCSPRITSPFSTASTRFGLGRLANCAGLVG